EMYINGDTMETVPSVNLKDMNIEIERSHLKEESAEKLRIPILESQKEIWLASMIGGESASKSYNLSIYEHLHGSLDKVALEMSLRELVIRHESLRATFSEDGTEMIITKEGRLAYEYIDVSPLSSENRNSFLTKFF